MALVNNKLISRMGDVVFANSDDYIVELPMAGREAETSIMMTALGRDEGARAVLMTAPLGAGKTFFLRKMLTLHADATPGFDQAGNVLWVYATDLDPDDDWDSARAAEAARELEARFDDVRGLRVLIVEELDRKASLDQLLWTTDIASAWVSLGGDRLLVATGEALRHPDVQSRLASVDQRYDIALESLDLSLLKSAVGGRIRERVVKTTFQDLDEAAAQALAEDATAAIFADEYIAWSAVPEADPAQLANFREALGVLGELAVNVSVDDDDAVSFPRRLLAEFDTPGQASGVAARLEAALLDELVASIASGWPAAALSVSDLAALVDRDPDDAFRRRGITPLANLLTIVPLGVPYSEVSERDGPIRYVGPFLPSYSLVHRALARLVGGAG